jgi:hypothetical protein
LAIVEKAPSTPSVQAQAAAAALLAREATPASEAILEPSQRDHLGAAAMIASHTLQHMYSHAFDTMAPIE